MRSQPTSETYREQLSRLSRGMGTPNAEQDVAENLTADVPLARVKMFVDGNLEKRHGKLSDALAFVAEAFSDFDRLVIEYIRDVPLAAGIDGAADAQKLLWWLGQSQSLSPAQHDYVACQNARFVIEDTARRSRIEHIHFQDLRSLTESWLEGFDEHAGLTVHLNPIHTFARFVSSALLEDDDSPPADVLFFAVGSEISSAVLETEGRALIRELADLGPCTVPQWRVISTIEDVELTGFCRDLAEMGILAFG